MEDGKRWAAKYANRISIVKIAKEEGVDPGTVSKWLKKAGVELKQGQHFVQQPALEISESLRSVLSNDPEDVIRLIHSMVWEPQVSPEGIIQLKKYCRFVELHRKGFGVNEIANETQVHRTTVAEWRRGSDLPYLVKVAAKANERPTIPGWKWIPLSVESGGNEWKSWIEVPPKIDAFKDIAGVLSQLPSLATTQQGQRFGIAPEQFGQIRTELFGYLLGMLVGDAGKRGGLQSRVSSMNIDLQLKRDEPTNERFGEFVCYCAGLFGLEMHRIKDKPPSGTQLLGESPSFAFRWISQRSPLVAWMFHDCLGLGWEELTSLNPLRMDWLFTSPHNFIKRFAQGVADSDGTVKQYVVEIASMPNAEFVTAILHHLGMASAVTRREGGSPMRSVVRIAEAASLPLFSEFARTYRFEKMRRLSRGD
ncbi:MAG TPA: hypothetical protein VFE91_03140 [Nitrososphaerales archaeon]|nr:hypothetical protein [Nitrososphaerales archaeon]